MKKTPPLSLAIVLLIAVTLCVAQSNKAVEAARGFQNGGSERETKLTQQLEKLLSPLGISVVVAERDLQDDAYQEIKILWTAYEAAPQLVKPEKDSYPIGREFRITGRRKAKGSLPRLRSLELSTEHLFVVSIDAKGTLINWMVILDPRLIRAEDFAPTGRVQNQEIVHRAKPEFVIHVPDNPNISELRFYSPIWTGVGFSLAPLGVTKF